MTVRFWYYGTYIDVYEVTSIRDAIDRHHGLVTLYDTYKKTFVCVPLIGDDRTEVKYD